MKEMLSTEDEYASILAENKKLSNKIGDAFEEGAEYAWGLAQEILGMDEWRLDTIFDEVLGEDVIQTMDVDDAAKALANFKAMEAKKEEEMARDAAIHDSEKQFADEVHEVVQDYIDHLKALGVLVDGIRISYPGGSFPIVIERDISWTHNVKEAGA